VTKTAPYLIVGGGMTAAAAIEGIRERDADGAIVLVGADAVHGHRTAPCARPPRMARG
jgi:3-phenylpropionate/trans-cinnamate dioxygenase ferredoxin reductase subunit